MRLYSSTPDILGNNLKVSPLPSMASRHVKHFFKFSLGFLVRKMFLKAFLYSQLLVKLFYDLENFNRKPPFFFFYLGFLSQTLTIPMSAEEQGSYLFNSSISLPPTPQILKH